MPRAKILVAAGIWLALVATRAAAQPTVRLPPTNPASPRLTTPALVARAPTALAPVTDVAPQALPPSEALWPTEDGLPPGATIEHSLGVPGNQDQDLLLEAPPDPWGAKPGFLQRVLWQNTWLPGDGAAAIDTHELLSYFTLGLPFPSVESPLLLTPGFAARWLAGPDRTDAPAHLFDATFEARWLPRISPRWRADLAISPGVYSDFERDHDRAFRLTGRALGLVDWRPRTKLALGVIYLNRGDLKLLPAVGLIHRPTDALRFEFILPQPRVAFRVAQRGQRSWWAYVGGEFGGGAWAVNRADGTEDFLALSDYRLRLGLESLAWRGLKSWWEVGYVFGRRLQYDSETGHHALDDAVLLRAGLAY